MSSSNDNNVDMARLELLIREHFAKTERQLADIRADNAEFRSQIKDDMNNFEAEVRMNLQSIRSEMNSRFDNVQAQINVMQNDITGLKHDVANLSDVSYWILAIVTLAFILPNFAEYVKDLFGAIRNGITGIIGLFRGKSDNT